MRRIKLSHEELRAQAKFTDPILNYSPWSEQEVLDYYTKGEFHPPYLVPNDNCYLIFNGNHRVLVAINNKLTIECQVLENLADVMRAQKDNMGNRDLSAITNLTFDNIVANLEKSADEWSGQNPDNWLE